MLKSQYLQLAVLFGLTQAEYVHNLDDEAHLADISSTGLTLSENNAETYLKITSNNGSTGYSWIIDHK